jgi:hypothetical protein
MKKVMLIDPDDYFTGRTKNTVQAPFDELKAYKKFKKFMAKEEAEAKAKKPKDDPKGWWAKKSVAERTVIIAFLGPPVGIGYVFCLMQMIKMLASTMGVH